MTTRSGKPDPSPAESGKRPSWRRWILGWVVIPGLIIAALFLSGMHVGARNPDMWLARFMVWLF